MIRNVLHTFGPFRTALAAAVGVPLVLAASAFAQTPANAPVAPVPNAPAAPEATTERVIVTGSYIPTAETESALPVTVYTAEVLKKQGANTPVEGLRQLPSFVGNAAHGKRFQRRRRIGDDQPARYWLGQYPGSRQRTPHIQFQRHQRACRSGLFPGRKC